MVRPANVWQIMDRIDLICSSPSRTAVTRLAIFCIVALVASAFAAPSQAGIDVFTGDLLKIANGPGSPGGVFYADVIGRGTSYDFDTFCVEMTEHIGFNTEYYVQFVGTSTNQGNKALGQQAAWLYSQFVGKNSSQLPGFNFINPSSAQQTLQADAMQYGIWAGMATPYSLTDIIQLSGWSASYVNGTLIPFLSGSLTNFNSAIANNQWSGTGKVQIISLRSFVESPTGNVVLADGRRVTLTGYVQDQLVQNSPELPSICTAMTALGCAGIWSVVSIRRKKRLAAAAA
jgi:hypothetical protein